MKLERIADYDAQCDCNIHAVEIGFDGYDGYNERWVLAWYLLTIADHYLFFADTVAMTITDMFDLEGIKCEAKAE